MNVDDVAQTTEYPADKLMSIVAQQTILMQKYHGIERDNGLLQTELVPVDIHDRHGQARLKDFAWRVTEEIAEATEAMEVHADIPQHALEELGDALHFLIELDILSGIDFDNDIIRQAMLAHDEAKLECGLDELYRSLAYRGGVGGDQFGIFYSSKDGLSSLIRGRAYSAIESLGKAMNCLKQKPWKQTHLLTDMAKYKKHLVAANHAFFLLCFTLMDAKTLYDVYCRKKQVNEFRIRSKY